MISLNYWNPINHYLFDCYLYLKSHFVHLENLCHLNWMIGLNLIDCSILHPIGCLLTPLIILIIWYFLLSFHILCLDAVISYGT